MTDLTPDEIAALKALPRGGTPFEINGAIARDDLIDFGNHPTSCEYDRRILLVSLRSALAAPQPPSGDAPIRGFVPSAAEPMTPDEIAALRGGALLTMDGAEDLIERLLATIEARSQPPSGDAPDLREALDRASLYVAGLPAATCGEPIHIPSFEALAALDIVKDALAASAPSSPTTPEPLEVERDHDHHFDARCETCNWLAGKSHPKYAERVARAYANQEGGEPR